MKHGSNKESSLLLEDVRGMEVQQIGVGRRWLDNFGPYGSISEEVASFSIVEKDRYSQ
jgi:hypothetical protein